MTIKLVAKDGPDRTLTVSDHRSKIEDLGFDVGHVAELLDMMAEHCAPTDDSEQCEAGNRVAYLGRQLRRTAVEIYDACEDIERLEIAGRQEGGAQ